MNVNQIVQLLSPVAEFGGVGVVAIVIIAALFQRSIRKMVNTWIQNKVSHGFDLKLEDHKHELGLQTERAKAQYQGDLQNLAIIHERRHEVCRELYRLVYEAQGHVGHLFGYRTEPLYELYSADEIREHIRLCNFPEPLIKAIVDGWERDRDSSVELIQKQDRVQEILHADEIRRKAWNYFLTNSLYLPDSVTEHTRQIFDTLRLILDNAKLPPGPKPHDSIELRQKASDLNWELRKKLQVVLGVPVDEIPFETDQIPE